MAERYGDEPLRLTIMYGRLPDLLLERHEVVQSEVLRVSPVLGVHTGPGVVGAAVAP
jgi:hypothetical protein